MRENVFLATLASIACFYKWTVDKSGEIRGTNRGAKGVQFDPITAVCRSKRKGTYPVTACDTAAVRLGINNIMSNNLQNAADGYGHNGYSQVLRGRIKSVLKLK